MLSARSIARGHGRWASLAILGLLAWSGCNSGGYSGPTGTVTGTVTLNGEPVPAGTNVAFVSDEGHTAAARVETGGQYKLAIAGKGHQIPVATYKVMVSPPVDTSPVDYNAPMDAPAPEPAKPEEQAIPVKFHSTTTSGLSYKVEAGSNTIDIKL